MLEDIHRLARGVDEHNEPLYVDSNGGKWFGVVAWGKPDMETMCGQWGCTGYGSKGEVPPSELMNHGVDKGFFCLWHVQDTTTDDLRNCAAQRKCLGCLVIEIVPRNGMRIVLSSQASAYHY